MVSPVTLNADVVPRNGTQILYVLLAKSHSVLWSWYRVVNNTTPDLPSCLCAFSHFIGWWVHRQAALGPGLPAGAGPIWCTSSRRHQMPEQCTLLHLPTYHLWHPTARNNSSWVQCQTLVRKHLVALQMCLLAQGMWVQQPVRSQLEGSLSWKTCQEKYLLWTSWPSDYNKIWCRRLY